MRTVSSASRSSLPLANVTSASIGEQTIGSSLVKPMSDALMGEDNPRIVRRLRDILITFGPAAREYANELKSSRNPAVRRAAIDLLRGLGGEAALPDLRNMLDDTDAQVQREALRAIIQVGSNEAYRLLEQALERGADRTRDMITQSLGGSYTVMTPVGFLARIDGKDADAIGEPVVTADAAAQEGRTPEELAWDQLRTCYDPEIPVNIVDLGLVYDMRIAPEGETSRVDVKMTLTAQGCGMGASIAADARHKILALPGVAIQTIPSRKIPANEGTTAQHTALAERAVAALAVVQAAPAVSNGQNVVSLADVRDQRKAPRA